MALGCGRVRGLTTCSPSIDRVQSGRSGSRWRCRVAAAVADAAAQLRRYLGDERLARQYPAVQFTGLVVVFHGWEMVACEAVSGKGGRAVR